MAPPLESWETLARVLVFSRDRDPEAMWTVTDEAMFSHENPLFFARQLFLLAAVRLERALPEEKIDELREWLVDRAVVTSKDSSDD